MRPRARPMCEVHLREAIPRWVSPRYLSSEVFDLEPTSHKPPKKLGSFVQIWVVRTVSGPCEFGALSPHPNPLPRGEGEFMAASRAVFSEMFKHTVSGDPTYG